MDLNDPAGFGGFAPVDIYPAQDGIEYGSAGDRNSVLTSFENFLLGSDISNDKWRREAA